MMLMDVRMRVMKRPGDDAAPAVRRGIGHIQAVHFAQFGTSALAGFGNILRHIVQIIKCGLTGKQHGRVCIRANGWKHVDVEI